MKRLTPLILFVLLIALLGLPLPASAAGADADNLISMVNRERTNRGLDPLAVDADLVAGAEYQAERIASAGRLFHNQDLGSVTTGWRKLGENVAYASTLGAAHDALMNSEGHRANILDPDYTHVGVGVVSRSGKVWVAEVFMESSTAPASVPVPSTFDGRFWDDDGSVHERDIEALAASGITQGCGEDKFCPKDRVTRGQMAAFLQRGLNLPNVSGDSFSDDNSSPFESAIESLAAAGITSGCGSGKFCPNAPVTRGQMAAFLQRALDLPPASGDNFSDDDRSPFENAIESLAAAGITSGCGTDRFCPDAPVTRQQMASFLVRAFGL